MTDSAGAVIEQTSYEPFGLVFDGGTQEDRGYTGKELDDTGLMYYGARYYNPEFMYWTQGDTTIPDIYNPQALNRYSYVVNNPYKYTDPDGKEFVSITTLALLYAAVETEIDIISLVTDVIDYKLNPTPENDFAWKLDVVDLFSGPLSNPGPSGKMYKLYKWYELTKVAKDTVSKELIVVSMGSELTKKDDKKNLNQKQITKDDSDLSKKPTTYTLGSKTEKATSDEIEVKYTSTSNTITKNKEEKKESNTNQNIFQKITSYINNLFN